VNNLTIRSRTVLLFFLMVGTLVYFNSFSVPFHYDDLAYLKENPHLKSFTVFGTWLSGSLVSVINGRAFLQFTFLLNYKVNGLDTFGYHLVNLLFHTGSAFLLYLILFRFVESDQRRNYSVAGMLAALLFLVHPIATESVTYLSSRSSVLATLCMLASILCFFLATEKKLRPGWYGASLLLFLLGLSTKESAVVLPALLLLTDYLLVTKDRTFRLARLKYHAPFFLIIGLLLVLYIPYISNPSADAIRPWSTHISTELRVIARYLGLLVMPIGLTIDHSVKPSLIMDGRVIFSLLLFLCLFAAAFYLRKTRPLITFSILWFFINMAPFLVIKLNDFMAERWVYAASIGFSIALAELLMLVARRYRGIGIALIAAVFVTASAMTVMRNQVYANQVTLWQDAARKAPDNYRPFSNLSRAYRENGNQAKAIECALESIKQADNRVPVKAYINLAAAYADQGEYQKAEDALKAVERYADGQFEYHNNRGVIAMKREQYPQAIQSFLRADELHPGSPTILFLLASCYEKLEQQENAKRYYLLTTQAMPNNGTEFMNQGVAFYKRGESQQALARFFEAVHADPQDVTLRLYLANYLRSAGHGDEAFKQYAAAANMAPDFVPARVGMGLVLLDQGRLDAAKAQFNTVMDMLPRNSPDRKEVQALIERCHG